YATSRSPARSPLFAAGVSGATRTTTTCIGESTCRAAAVPRASTAMKRTNTVAPHALLMLDMAAPRFGVKICDGIVTESRAEKMAPLQSFCRAQTTTPREVAVASYNGDVGAVGKEAAMLFEPLTGLCAGPNDAGRIATFRRDQRRFN